MPDRDPVGEPRIEPDRLDSAVGLDLVQQLQGEYLVRYGGIDETPIAAAEFVPPRGDFLVAWAEDTPVGCGGWRVLAADPGTAEIKRTYVVPSARRFGVGRRLLAALEVSAGRAGLRRVLLETGERQPEAIGLYAAMGYRPVPAFGHYVDDPESVYLGKQLCGTDH